MEKIDFSRVTKSYNGRAGCACGCNGDYTIPSHVSIEQANRDIGYNGYSESDISDRRVKIALKKVNDAIEQYKDLVKEDNDCLIFDDQINDVWFAYSEDWASIQRGGRSSTVYFK